MIAYYDRNVQLIDWLNFFVSGIDCEGTFVYNFCIFKKKYNMMNSVLGVIRDLEEPFSTI